MKQDTGTAGVKKVSEWARAGGGGGGWIGHGQLNAINWMQKRKRLKEAKSYASAFNSA
jgi:hypothetical protein